MKTPVITYNLKERGRAYRGKARHFNIGAVVASINGPGCQERVKNRDMVGYYGHWPRVKFGLEPREGGLDGGKPALVEPALITTYLKAFDDGTIEHQAEFLDTDSGKVAAKLFASRAGGFSSAIDGTLQTFWGFDYVLEPNFTTNRGYLLDDAGSMTPEDVEAAIYDEQLRGLNHLLDAAHAEREQANEAIERLRVENEELLSLLAAKGIDGGAQLDSAAIAPIVLSGDATERMRSDMAFFREAALPAFAEPESRAENTDPLYARLLNQFLR